MKFVAFRRTAAIVLCASVLASCGGGGSSPLRAGAAPLPTARAQPVAADYAGIVQQLYVSYYGRPADPAGLAYWAGALAAGGAPADLASFVAAYGSNGTVKLAMDSFGTSAESAALYGGDNAAIVTAIYQNLFNRAPDPAGLAYWLNALNTGQMSAAQAAMTIATGALTTDAQSVQNKVAVATGFTSYVSDSSQSGVYAGLAPGAAMRSALSAVGTSSDVAAGTLQTVTALNALAKGGSSDGSLVKVPQLATGFVFGPQGSATQAAAEVIDGNASVKGSYSGTNSYNWYLGTDPTKLPLAAGATYTVTFRYKILAAPDKGFEAIFFSPTAAAASQWLPSSGTIQGNAGDTGVVTFKDTLLSYPDYQVRWDIIGSGAIAIDDIQITDAQGTVVATENVEQGLPTYEFANQRTSYVLNLTGLGTDVVDKGQGTHTLVPFGARMSFAGSTKFSKDTRSMLHHVRAHAEVYEGWDAIADLPVDFLRTGANWDYGPGGTSGFGYSPFTSTFRFPDRADKVIVGYVNSTEYTHVGGTDLAFDPSWDQNGDGIIDAGTANLAAYVDTKVFDSVWRGYVAAYWTDAWRAQLQRKIDLVATEGFDGVMLDVMTGYWTWASDYPNLDVATLRQQYADLVRWASNYAKTTYGTAFAITANLDPDLEAGYFPDLGSYVDAGYYQAPFFDWSGSGVVDGYGLSTSTGAFSNPALDFIRGQGLALLDMDQIGTGSVTPGLTFTNYDDQVTRANFLKLFNWAIASGSTPYSTTEFFGAPFSGGFPRFVRIVPGTSPFTGTSYSEWVIGSNQDDAITTGTGDDLIYGGPGNDVIDGGAGINTAYYVGARANFTITSSGGKVVVSDSTGAEGTDTLTNIRYLQFADQTVDVQSLPAN